MRGLRGRFLGRPPSGFLLASPPCGFVLNRTPLILLLGRPSCGFCRSPHRSGLGGPPCCLFGSGLTGSFLRSSPTRSPLRSNSARGLLGLDQRCLLRFGLPCSLLLVELRAPFRLFGVDRVALREDLPLMRQALQSTPRFASPVHVVDGVSSNSATSVRSDCVAAASCTNRHGARTMPPLAALSPPSRACSRRPSRAPCRRRSRRAVAGFRKARRGRRNPATSSARGAGRTEPDARSRGPAGALHQRHHTHRRLVPTHTCGSSAHARRAARRRGSIRPSPLALRRRP